MVKPSSCWFETSSEILDGGLLLQLETHPKSIHHFENFYDIQLDEPVCILCTEQKSTCVNKQYIQLIVDLAWTLMHGNDQDFALDMNNGAILRRRQKQLEANPTFFKYLAGKVDFTWVKLDHE